MCVCVRARSENRGRARERGGRESGSAQKEKDKHSVQTNMLFSLVFFCIRCLEVTFADRNVSDVCRPAMFSATRKGVA